jgi:hypothetical protein
MMSDAVLLAGKLLFATVALCAGIRLARITRQEGGLSVHSWASAMIFVGGFGLAGFALGPGLAEFSKTTALYVMLGSDVLERLALIALAVFIWRIFGIQSLPRALVLGATVMVVTGEWLYTLWSQRWPDSVLPWYASVARQIVFSVPFIWSTVEAGLEHLKSRRRLALGLVDPVTTNRLLLWTEGCAFFSIICFLEAGATAASTETLLFSSLRVVQGILYAVIAVLVILILFPPTRYLDWISVRASGPNCISSS